MITGRLRLPDVHVGLMTFNNLSPGLLMVTDANEGARHSGVDLGHQSTHIQ